jgi:hypothetical protein
MERQDMIDGIQDILLNQGIDEPVLLGIVSKFLSKCPPLYDDIQIGGGLNEFDNQFVIIDVDGWQLVLVIDYPNVRGFIGNSDSQLSFPLEFIPNLTKEIQKKNMDMIFSYYSNIALIFATAKDRYPHRLLSEQEFQDIADEIGFLDL